MKEPIVTDVKDASELHKFEENLRDAKLLNGEEPIWWFTQVLKTAKLHLGNGATFWASKYVPEEATTT